VLSHLLRLCQDHLLAGSEDNSDQDSNKLAGMPAWLLGGVLLLIAAVIGYSLLTGGVVEKVNMPGGFGVDMGHVAPTPAAARPVASRDFVLGRWEVEQNEGPVSGGTSLQYDADGTLSGHANSFNGGEGRREDWQGNWTFETINNDEFRLHADINGQHVDSRFRIFDINHVQNEDQNYAAVRIP
jgi:hypothetical protein